MKKKVFISFDYDNDSHYRRLLSAWDAHDDFDFGFYDGSLRSAINSTDADYIKSKIRPMIKDVPYFLCLIGKQSAQSDWIAWEIDQAVENSKIIIAVKIDRSNVTPSALYNVSASWAMSFTFDAIKKAIDEA